MIKYSITNNFVESNIYIGETLDKVTEYLPGSKVIIITDDEVFKYYGSQFPKFPVIKIGRGEQIKTIDTVTEIVNNLINLEADRSYFLLGIGGGIVCDITGFVASIYMRGIKFGFVSTTLLSQVDASVGGKNGVNHNGYKNMIGVFAQPQFVICDQNVLKTLHHKDFISGFGEIVKHAAIRSYEMFVYLENNVEQALNKSDKVIAELVNYSVQIKSKIVQNDEKEAGERKLLNFGHTFGHTFEKLVNVVHGEAVSAGMIVAAKLSMKLNLITENEFVRLKKLLSALLLPVELDVDYSSMFKILKKDKKRDGDEISLVLLNGLGNAIIKKIKLDKLEELLNDLC